MDGLEEHEDGDGGALPQTTSFRQMARVLREYQRRVERIVEPVGLRREQYEAMVVIESWGDVRQAKLAEACLVSRQAIHELVSDLKRLGFVTTWSDPRRREVRVLLTEEGRQVQRRANAAMQEFRKDIIDRFGVRNQAALKTLLEQLGQVLFLWGHAPHLFEG